MSEQEIFNFATIGEVFEDGVSLIFDGQDAATEKHYRINTSIVFKAGDRVKILADSGTYVVEYVVGPPKKPEDEPVGIPAGGTAGQSLLKETDSDHAVIWGSPEGVIPAGGGVGQVLKKKTTTDYDAQWGAVDGVVPTGGSTGQVLKKSGNTDYAMQWGDVDGTLPTGGSKGQALVKDSSTYYDVSWGAPGSANSVVNQYRPTSEGYNIYLQTDYSGNFYIRFGTSGTWKKITVT